MSGMTGTATLSEALHRMADVVRRVPMRSGRYADADARTELRDAALQLLQALDDSTTSLCEGISVDTVLRGLRMMNVAALGAVERHEVARCIAPVMATLQGSEDSDVHRVLLDATPVGTTLGSLLDETDPRLLDPDAQLSFVSACERQAAWVHARQDAGLLAFAGSNPRESVYYVRGEEHELVDARRTEIAAELHWSEAMAHARLTQARALAVDLPMASAALGTGSISPRTVAAVCEGAERLTSFADERIERALKERRTAAELDALRDERRALLVAFERRVIPYAERHDLSRTRAAVNRAIAVIDPLGFAARRARAERRLAGVRIDQDADGMATLSATMPGEQARACMRAIDTLAKAPSFMDPAQPIGVRRAASLVSLLTRTDGVPPAHSTMPVCVDVVIDLETLIGLNENPAHAVGVGALPAAVARELISSDPRSTIRRIVTDPVTATPRELGRRRYRVDAQLRRLIEARDGTCRFTDCGQPAHRCDCDHATPYGDGGATNVGNLGLACKRHHQCKTQAGWQVFDSDEDGSCTWESPLGRSYQHDPIPLLPALETQTVHERDARDGRLCAITRRAFALHHSRSCSVAHALEDCPRLRQAVEPGDDPAPF